MAARIDGKAAPTTLIERIAAEDGVGSNLAERTRQDYANKIELMARAIARNGAGGLTPAALVMYLSGRIERGDLSQASARSYKAAALFWLADEGQRLLAQGADLSAQERAYQVLRAVSIRHLPVHTEATSSAKLKLFPQAMLDAVIAYGRQTPQSRHAGRLIAFLHANLQIGLRPEEWFGVSFMSYLHRRGDQVMREADGQPRATLALVVANAKATQGRANGDYRDILLHGVADAELAQLIHFHEITRDYASKFPADAPRQVIAASFFKPLQQALNRALTRQGYRAHQRPTLYSTRHQAVANAKSSGMTDREIAALFGHASVATAKTHYGKKIHGWRKMAFRPSPESVAAVPERRLAHDPATPTQRILDTAAQWNRTVGFLPEPP